jgi:hypothetical protein
MEEEGGSRIEREPEGLKKWGYVAGNWIAKE